MGMAVDIGREEYTSTCSCPVLAGMWTLGEKRLYWVKREKCTGLVVLRMALGVSKS